MFANTGHHATSQDHDANTSLYAMSQCHDIMLTLQFFVIHCAQIVEYIVEYIGVLQIPKELSFPE